MAAPIIYGTANCTDEVQASPLMVDGTSYIDNAWQASSMQFQANGDTSYSEQGYFGGLTTVWLHWYQQCTNNWGANTIMYVYNAAGTNIFKVLSTGGGHQCQYWNGTAFVNVGVSVPISGNTQRFDLHIVIAGASSLIELYRGGILLASTTFDGSNAAVAAGVDHWRVRACDSFAGGQGAVAEMITSDSPTINFRYSTRLPATLGSHQTWTGSGTIANVAKATINDNTFIQSPTAAQETTYKPAANTNVSGAQTILLTKIIIRGRLDSTGPQNIAGMFTIASTDYFSSNIPLTFGFAGHPIVFANDPSTGVAWTPAVAGGTLEFGVRSAT
jgi:hypothetical protein